MSFDVQSRSDSTVFPVDNVHFQQAAQISKALVDERVDFEAMVNIGSGKWVDGVDLMKVSNGNLHFIIMLHNLKSVKL